MSAAPIEIEDTDLSTFEDIEIPCDVKGMAVGNYGLPNCKDDPAEWVGWRACPCGIAYRLVCTHCRDIYLQWQANNASIVCASCNADTGGFHNFTPLNKGS